MTEERRFALLVEYDGTEYVGSQYQVNGPTIQSALEAVIVRLGGGSSRVAMAGRTDSGVHAEGQVAAATLRWNWTAGALVRALNANLPDDIAVKAAAETPLDFDPRRQARRRWYRYLLYNGSVRSPLNQRFAWFVKGFLDIGEMQVAAQELTGERNFAAFAAPLAGVDAGAVRRVERTGLARSGPLVAFDIEANAFLPHQVRRTIGALVDVGAGRLTTTEFVAKAKAAVPGSIGPTAPSCGLRLMRVTYDVSWFDQGAVGTAQEFGKLAVIPTESG